MIFQRDEFEEAARVFQAKLPGDFRPVVVIACPFCARKRRLKIAVAGESGEDGAAVAHEMDACDEFVRMAPEEYLEAARVAMQNEVN